jgi:hypothetical protein
MCLLAVAFAAALPCSPGDFPHHLLFRRQKRTIIVANQIPRICNDKTYLLPKFSRKGYFRLVEVSTLG